VSLPVACGGRPHRPEPLRRPQTSRPSRVRLSLPERRGQCREEIGIVRLVHGERLSMKSVLLSAQSSMIRIPLAPFSRRLR
jgi:hypothetical protein